MTSTAPVLAIFGLGTTELLVIGVIGLLLFGSRLPMVGRNIGKSITEFKKGMKDAGEELSREDGQRPQLTQDQVNRATDEARRMKAEQGMEQR
ncbi:MAG: twin-arginine translocase TatA/TatE family subunit [Planctomycetota bacterium]